jgi:hypothetical protein
MNMKKTLSVSIPIAWTRNRLTTISVDCETTLSQFYYLDLILYTFPQLKIRTKFNIFFRLQIYVERIFCLLRLEDDRF